MHTSRADLPATVVGDYEGRSVDWGDFRVAFEAVELIELSPVAEHDKTMAVVMRNMAGALS